MKKFFLFSLLSFILGMNSAFAQDILVANLSHNGTVTNFYGIDALKNAHEAAEHGDTIILSQGTFNTSYFTISKAVTIYGAGMDLNADGQGTIFSDGFHINITDDVNIPLHVEGIHIINKDFTVTKTTKNSIFTKCRLYSITVNDEMTFMHCRITDRLSGNANKLLYNCFLSENSNVSNLLMYNCVIWSLYGNLITNSCLYNCIIRYPGSFASTNTMYNNVCIESDNAFKDVTAGSSNSLSTYAEIFKTYTGTYSDTETFELTDAAKTTYLGIDGTQVGLYGSATPFDPIPTIPLITSYQVAAKAANGKVSVNVEINGGED